MDKLLLSDQLYLFPMAAVTNSHLRLTIEGPPIEDYSPEIIQEKLLLSRSLITFFKFLPYKVVSTLSSYKVIVIASGD